MDRSLEGGEEALGRVADDVGEDVEPPAMSDSHRDLADVAGGGAFEELVQERDRRLAAFDRVAALAEESRAEEFLEGLGGDELFEEPLAQVRRERLTLGRRGDVLTDPVFFGGARDVAVFGPDPAAVDAAHHADDVAQRHVVASGKATGPEGAVEVPDRQAVGFEVQLRVRLERHHAERVYVGDQVPAHAVRVDELEDPRLLEDLSASPVAGDGGVLVHGPVEGLLKDAEVREGLLVEVASAEKQLLDAA